MVTVGRMQVVAWACALAGCSGPDAPSLAERLQGSWTCSREAREGAFLRSDIATLGVDGNTIRYAWNVLWGCADAPACAPEPPPDRGGYFEGVFRQAGDSLVLRDGVDTLGFREVAESSFTFVVNGTAFPMRRR